VMELIRRAREVLSIAKAADVARRVAVMNFFDGIMVGSGLVLGMFLSGTFSYQAALMTVLSVAVGSAISGFTGAWIAERIEQEHRLRKLEEAILADLKGTLYQRVARSAPVLVGTVNGLSAAFGVGIVAMPFLLSLLLNADPLIGTYASVTVSLGLLVTVGLALERALHLRTVFAVKRLLTAGLATMLLVLAMDLLVRAL